jgi:class 3 adenylate cyclase
MPDLKQQIKLKTKYPAALSELKPPRLKNLVEAFDPSRIEKAFAYTDETAGKYIEHFRSRKKEEVILLFVDIASFSIKFQSTSSDKIASYLDSYYDKVIPIIHKYGGEVEKIIGDGIICVFGKPFLELDIESLHRVAENCSIKIVSELKGTEHESKIALHYGEVMYYQNQTDSYYEFTMIGSALTELFRLESVSTSNSINFYCDTYYESLNINDVSKAKSRPNSIPQWTLCIREDINLKGVSYSAMRRLEKK